MSNKFWYKEFLPGTQFEQLFNDDEDDDEIRTKGTIWTVLRSVTGVSDFVIGEMPGDGFKSYKLYTQEFFDTTKYKMVKSLPNPNWETYKSC